MPRVVAHSQTTLRLFQRALLPGPNGAVVTSDQLLPIHEYWSLRAQNLRVPWSDQTGSAEIAGWVELPIGEPDGRPPATGDVGSAWFRQPWGAFELTLGRQATFGGAARYARFDGAEASVRGPVAGAWHAGGAAYAGYTVLPRWDSRPGYFHLGSTVDSLVRDDSALPDATRTGNRLLGARAHLNWDDRAFAALSVHEEHERGHLARQQLGVDLQLDPLDMVSIDGALVANMDSWQVADASVWLDFEPDRLWLLQLEAAHADPRLFLSHQSVFSVFDTSGYDELGAELTHRPWRHLATSAGAFVQWFGHNHRGGRGLVRLRADVDRARTTWVGATYSRVVLPEGGYHLLAQSLSRKLLSRLRGSAQTYFYWYDRPIAGRRTSNVYAGNLEWSFTRNLNLLWGASLAQTPYAAHDLQTLLRLNYAAQLLGASSLGGAQ